MAKTPVEQLSELFGSYKAEYLRERIFELYTQPAYFPELETNRPCALIGGRGTGKTTVLRSLSYQGRYALDRQSNIRLSNWSYFGFYTRVDTNRVTAFKGPDLSEEVWQKLFAHYINLIFCYQILEFLDWYKARQPDSAVLDDEAVRLFGLSFGIQIKADKSRKIKNVIGEKRLEFEAFLNNLRPESLPPLSLQGAPIDELMRSVNALPQFQGRYFFLIIDEYENFLDYQQRVINTIIKHSGTLYTFKVGARELGWRIRDTLNDNERLSSPADYARIDISEKLKGRQYEHFAASILNQRIAEAASATNVKYIPIQDLLPSLSLDREAEILGVRQSVNDLIAAKGLDKQEAAAIKSIPSLEAYVLLLISKGKEEVKTSLKERENARSAWKVRYDSYKFSSLFTIRAGKPGFRKAYCGWHTFVLLSGGNIRYLIELVDQTLIAHSLENSPLDTPIPWESQTKSAILVGRKNVSELEGVDVNGALLTKLVLGLGRVFQIMARDPSDHTPEVTQFDLSPDQSLDTEVIDLLRTGVMHLALVRYSSTKLAGQGFGDYDYALHPIYAAFFEYSYRKKRKMRLRGDKLVELTQSPGAAIASILQDQNREVRYDFPEQLKLFEDFYGKGR